MKLVPDSSVRRSAAVFALALTLAGCTGSAPTPVVVFLTPSPAASSTATSAPTSTPTSTPEVTTTPAATETLAATPTATAAVSPSPAASPTSVAAACTGTADNKAFLVEAASKLTFNVYCAVLPSGWWLQGASYVLPAGGYLDIAYRNAGGASITLREGDWCPPEKACIAHGPSVGPASFGGLAGTLHVYTESGSVYNLEVGTYAAPQYLMVGSGMTQAQFTAWAAALIRVPKT